MKCESCQVEINPKWTHALTSNICPMCGGQVLPEHLKVCLANLTIAMKDMASQYPDQLEDWLLSNYSYIKTDNPNLKDYLPKEVIQDLRKEVAHTEVPEKTTTKMQIKNAKGQIETIEVETKKTQSQEKTNGFFERAQAQGIKKTKGGAEQQAPKSAPSNIAERTSYLKDLAKQIKAEGNQSYLGEADLVQMIENDGEPTVDELSSAIGSGDIIQSALPNYSDGEDEEVPMIVQNMASRAKQGGDNSQKDLQSLQNMHQKASGSSKRMLGGSGSFSR